MIFILNIFECRPQLLQILQSTSCQFIYLANSFWIQFRVATSIFVFAVLIFYLIFTRFLFSLPNADLDCLLENIELPDGFSIIIIH